MPDAVAVSVAKAVTAMLADASLSQEITPERSYADWAQPLEKEQVSDTDRLYVDVVQQATGLQAELDDRGSNEYTTFIDIAIRKRFGPSKQSSVDGRVLVAEVDAMMLLVQEVYELFMPERLTDFEDAVWDPEQGTRILVAPLKKHLYEHKQFTGIVRIGFIASAAH